MKDEFYLLAIVKTRPDDSRNDSAHQALVDWRRVRILHRVLEEWILTLLGKIDAVKNTNQCFHS